MKADNHQKRLTAYNALRDAVRNIWHEAGEKTLPTLRQALDKAAENASELKELGREEMQTIREYLQRDIQDAAQRLSENGHELAEWLEFDLEFAEKRLGEWVAQVADPTRLELEQLAERAQVLGEWHSGEITGSGTLICTACGEQLHFDKAGHVPPCPECHATVFSKAFLSS